MKTLIFITALLLSGMANAKTILVMGQSNAVGIVRSHALNTNVINCTKSGQPIAKFQLNFTRGSIFGNCMTKVHGKIDAVVFWQGEADTRSMAAAEEWGYKASRLIRDIQSYAGSIPIVMVALNKYGCADCKALPEAWQSVRSQQLGFLGVTVIDSSDYEFKPDDVHLTPSGYADISLTIKEILK